MRRIMSVLVLLTLLLGATGLFAASADWKGYFIVKYVNTGYEKKDGAKDFSAYFWQKLELYPSWKLSENVTINAGFFTQNYWGNGRFYGIGTDSPISEDTGNFKSGTGGVMGTDTNPLNSNSYTAQDVTLGVSSAWAVLSFMDGSLTVDVGRRRNPEWGTGLFLGSAFTPDRIFVTYRTSGFGGMLLPFIIYEHRVDNSISYSAFRNRMYQLLFGLIYFVPGKTVAGIVFNPNFVGTGYVLANGTYPASNYTKDSQVFWVNNLYIKHSIVAGPVKITPEFEFNWGFGTILDNGAGSDLVMDAKSFLIKVAVNMPKMFTFTPEFGLALAPKKAEATKMYFNAYSFNEFCGSLYQIGLIYNGKFSNKLLTLNTAIATEVPSAYYLKLKAEADILGEFVKGLNAYVAYIMASVFGEQKNGSAVIVDSDKPVLDYEIDLGVSYQIDSYAKFGIDFGYAKWGKSTKYLTAGNIEKKETYFGANLEVKF